MALPFSRASATAFSSRSTQRHLAGLAPDQGVQAKAAGVATQVEHRPAGTEPGQVAAVVALIAEKAGLVGLVEVDAVPDPMFLHGHSRRQVDDWRAAARKVFQLRHPLVDPDTKMRGPKPGRQSDRIGPIR